MRGNGVEKLTCITKIRDITHDGGTLKIEPLRNFPIVTDLVVDLGPLYARMEQIGAKQVYSLADAPIKPNSIAKVKDKEAQEEFRLTDCIECGCCISACPIASTTEEYLGPAVLAAAQLNGLDKSPECLHLVDSGVGVWRCHSAFECTAVCPSNVEPGWRIMDLRKQAIVQRIKKFFGQA
jgi:succinate dehydrogenase / fumarate reductase iron-sulfur subunit